MVEAAPTPPKTSREKGMKEWLTLERRLTKGRFLWTFQDRTAGRVQRQQQPWPPT